MRFAVFVCRHMLLKYFFKRPVALCCLEADDTRAACTIELVRAHVLLCNTFLLEFGASKDAVDSASPLEPSANAAVC